MDHPTHCRHEPARASGDNPVEAVYVELAPPERHRPFVDHCYVLRDDGVLTAAERSLFASPFGEINFTLAHGQEARGWRRVDLPPRFGSRRRRQPFHGWMLGIRCRSLEGLNPPERGEAMLSEDLVLNIGDGAPLDRLVGVLDACLDRLFPAAVPPAPSRGAALDGRPDVRALARAAGLSPRTLQRQVRARTGLAPKRWLALLRFSRAAAGVALARASLAEIAMQAGYADQAHMSAEFARHAATSPGRFRARARRQVRQDAVRFFQDPALRRRIRLLVVAP